MSMSNVMRVVNGDPQSRPTHTRPSGERECCCLLSLGPSPRRRRPKTHTSRIAQNDRARGRALVADAAHTKLDSAGTSSDVERRQESGMKAAQSVLLIVADDMQPSDIHALRHLHAPPILAETPWQALEHVPIWNFEPQ